MARGINISDMRFFVAAYEARGFLRAARRLGTVQSNVSTRIAGLEKRLGATLFERRYRSVEATAAGRKLYPRARRVLFLFDKMQRRFSAGRRRHRKKSQTRNKR